MLCKTTRPLSDLVHHLQPVAGLLYSPSGALALCVCLLASPLTRVFIANHVVQMRAGTQTLIQVLQALPWAGDPEDDGLPIATLQGDDDSDEDSEG
jgi:hypothetical protein